MMVCKSPFCCLSASVCVCFVFYVLYVMYFGGVGWGGVYDSKQVRLKR